MPDLIISGGPNPNTVIHVDDNIDVLLNGTLVPAYSEASDTMAHDILPLTFTNVHTGDVIQIKLYDYWAGYTSIVELWAHYLGKSFKISDPFSEEVINPPFPRERVLKKTITHIVNVPFEPDEPDRCLRGCCRNGNPSYSPSGTPLSYNGAAGGDSPASMGWGWNLPGFNLKVAFDTQTQTLLLKDGSGRFERWTLKNSVYVPAHSDNYIKVFKDTSNRYVLTYPNRDVLTFRASDGKIDTLVNRNGQTTTYGYNDVQNRLTSVNDGEGRITYLTYATTNATDLQLSLSTHWDPLVSTQRIQSRAPTGIHS